MLNDAIEAIEVQIAIWKAKTGSTYEDLASILGISVVALRSKRQGETEFSMGEIVRMCNLFGVSPNVLTGWGKE